MKKIDKRYCCKYTVGVVCPPYERKCEKCGWNPEVSENRLQKIKEARGYEACKKGSTHAYQPQEK